MGLIMFRKDNIDTYLKNAYLSFFSIFCFCVLLSDFTTFSEFINPTIISCTKYLCVGAILLKILIFDLRQWKYDEKIKVLLLLFFIVLITYFSGNRSFIQYFILIIGSREIPFKTIISTLLVVEIIVVIATIFGSLLGVLPNYIYGRSNSNVIRISLGFKDYKYLSMIMYSISMYLLFLYKNKTKKFFYFILLILNFFVFLLTNSRNELLFSVLLILGVYFYFNYTFSSKQMTLFNTIVKYSGFFFSVILFILSVIYNGNISLLKSINTLFSGRLNLAHQAISEYGLSLFGTHIEWFGQSTVNLNNVSEMYNFVDISYIKNLLEYGLIGLFIILFMIFTVVKINEKSRNGIGVFLLIILMHSTLDPHLFSIVFNVFLLMFVDCIFIKPTYMSLNQNQKISNYFELGKEDIQREEVQMLKDLVQYLESNKLTYYLCGGSLLGAIRHHGFIPWDDDIDILMPRKDYEQLMRLSKNLRIKGYLEVHSLTNKNLNDPFCKVLNMNTEMDKYYIDDDFDRHLWIDIFPMDGLSKTQIVNRIIYKIIIFLRRLNVMLKAKQNIIDHESKSNFRRCIKVIFRIFLSPIKTRWIALLIEKIALLHPFDKCQFVGGVVWGYGPQEKLEKSKLQDTTVIFEGLEVNTFACWDEYLTNLYGDYMKLPPEDKRISHVMKVYKSIDIQ